MLSNGQTPSKLFKNLHANSWIMPKEYTSLFAWDIDFNDRYDSFSWTILLDCPEKCNILSL